MTTQAMVNPPQQQSMRQPSLPAAPAANTQSNIPPQDYLALGDPDYTVHIAIHDIMKCNIVLLFLFQQTFCGLIALTMASIHVVISNKVYKLY